MIVQNIWTSTRFGNEKLVNAFHELLLCHNYTFKKIKNSLQYKIVWHKNIGMAMVVKPVCVLPLFSSHLKELISLTII